MNSFKNGKKLGAVVFEINRHVNVVWIRFYIKILYKNEENFLV